MDPRLTFFLAAAGGVLALAGALHLIARLGATGRAICDVLARAPALDVVVFAFTHGPWVAAGVVWAGRWGRVDGAPAWSTSLLAYLLIAILGQCAAMFLWSWGHELARRGLRPGPRPPRIVSTLNRRVGWFRNHVAVWITALAVPVFTLVRVAEYVVYPPLHWLIRLPKYKHGDWVNVSRQKFEGLVGYDLIWCLYCDWMTGVWSLGSEMLRNVESFWCPIRFGSPEKCANCAIDFPDVAGDWVRPDGTMQEVTQLLERKYPGPKGDNAWFGHPVRLTVKGNAAETGRAKT